MFGTIYSSFANPQGGKLMGFIEYNNQGRQAIIRDELHNVINYAFQDLYDAHWELSSESIPHKDRILRALDSHLLLY